MSSLSFYTKSIYDKEEKEENSKEKINKLKKQKQKIKDETILLEIYIFLTPIEVEIAKMTCHFWYKAASDHILWNKYLKNKYKIENHFYFVLKNEHKEIQGRYSRYLYKYRQYYENLIKKSKIQVIKKFDQCDLKLLLTKESYTETFSYGYVDVMKQINQKFGKEVSIKPNRLSPSQKVLYDSWEIINNEWIDSGFHIRSVELKDEEICIDVKIYQNKNEESYKKKVINEIMTFSQLSTKNNYLKYKNEQWVQKILDYSSELNKTEYCVRNLIGKKNIFLIL